MYLEPTELLWIGCLTGLIFIKKIQIRFIDTKHQLADILTKCDFSRDKRNKILLCTSDISALFAALRVPA